MRNPLYQWLEENKYQLAKGVKGHTNVSFDGHSFRIPQAAYATFLNKYVHVVKKSPCAQYMVEARTPVFKLFADLDFKADGPVPAEAIQDVARFIAQQTANLYCREEASSSAIYLIVCTAPPRRLPNGDWKTGVHLHWPHILTDDPTALMLRQALVARCASKFPAKTAFDKKDTPTAWPQVRNDWGDILDPAVYGASGLRMIYSRKKEIPSVYQPAFVVRGEMLDVEPVEAPLDDLRRWVLETSIRSFETEKTPTSAQLAAVELSAVHQRADVVGESMVGHEEGLEALASLLAAQHPEYQGMRFSGLARVGEDCYFLRSPSHYCLNLALTPTGGLSQHRGTNIFFVVTRTAVYQKCFCTCETVEHRRFGRCRNFRGPSLATPPALRLSLFGDAAPVPPRVEAVDSATLCDMQYDQLMSFSCVRPKKPSRKRRRV